MRVARAGHAFFAATLIAIGFLGLAKGDFAPIWQPVPKSFPAREALAYLCAVVALACGAGLLWERTAAIAARVLLGYLIVWLLLIKAPFIVASPASAVAYESNGETAVLVAAALALSAIGTHGVRIARVIYALSMIAFGVAHFAYVELTASLVPEWLPSRISWAYFTGCTYIAAGVAMLVGFHAGLAATLSAIQIGLFTLLVWVPVVVVDPNSRQWTEFVVSWALSAAAWVIATQRAPRNPAPEAIPLATDGPRQ
jgi:uncharacterized membrane protein